MNIKEWQVSTTSLLFIMIFCFLLFLFLFWPTKMLFQAEVTWLPLPTAYQIPNVIAALHRSCLDVHNRLCFDTASAINLPFNFPQRGKIRKMVKTHIRRSVFMKQIKPSTRANSKFIVETLLTVQFNPGLRLICVWETGPQKFMHWCGRVEQTGSFPVGFLDKQFLMSCFREHTSNMYSWHTLLAANTLKGNQCWFHWDGGFGGEVSWAKSKFRCKHFFAGSFLFFFLFFLLRRWFILSTKRTEAMYRSSLKHALT